MRTKRRVAGIDSSTQSCKLVVLDSDSGELLRSSALPHPDGTELDPHHWWDAFEGVGGTALTDIDALAITAQQHSTIFLDGNGDIIRDAILWNDSRAISQGLSLRTALGSTRWAHEIGVLPGAAHPVSKLRWLAETEPENAQRLHSVMLPHDWLTWTLRGGARSGVEPTTDRSDASSTGYWSATAGEYRPDVIALALGHDMKVPRVLGPSEPAGRLPNGPLVAPGLGDNAATHLGLGSVTGEAVVSIGTSLTISVTWPKPLADETGRVDDMADGTDRYLPIVVSLNGARTLSATARMLGVSLAALDRLASEAPPDACGLTFLPFLDGERTPLLPGSTGSLVGLTRASMTAENFARAAVLGMANSVAEGIEDLQRAGAPCDSITVVGGGARSSSLRQAIADLTGLDVVYPQPLEYAARGAAFQAARLAQGTLPRWKRRIQERHSPTAPLSWVDAVRSSHREFCARLFLSA